MTETSSSSTPGPEEPVKDAPAASPSDTARATSDEAVAATGERKPLGKTETAGLVGLLIGLLLGLAIGYFIWGSSGDDGASPAGESSSAEATVNGLLSEGLALQQAGQNDAASAKYTEALGLDASNKFALYNLALINQTAGNLGAAIDLYRRALTSDPAFTSARYNLALALRDSGNTDGAIAELETVIIESPNGAGGLINLGNLLIEKGDTTRGEELVARGEALSSATP